MKESRNIWKGPAAYTLGAAVLIGGLAVASAIPRHTVVGPETTVQARPILREAASTAPPVADMTMLRTLDASFSSLAQYAAPAVVHIKVQGKPQSSMLGERVISGGEGSGVIFRPDGWILTNDHVVGGMDKVTVILNDGREFPGTVKRAADADLAVVKIEASDLPTLPFADSDKVKPGQFSMAIGAPFGYENSVSIGHVSATGRSTAIPDARSGGARGYGDLIQTDTAINMGNSGGPLINVDGQVIGINTAILSTTGGSNGVGFAIASNEARMLAETLIQKGEVRRGFMGVVPETLKAFHGKEIGLDGGATLIKVESDAPGAIGGLREGDVVVRIGDVTVHNQSDLRNAMYRYGPGQTVEVEYVRDRKRQTAKVTLKEAPSPKPAAPMGLGGDGDVPNLDIPNGFRLNPPSLAPGNGQPRLGVQVGDVNDSARKQFSIPAGVEGAVVAAVEPGSTAEKAGVQVGDVITGLGDSKVNSAQSLVSAIATVKRGERRQISFSRYGGHGQMKLSVTAQF